MGAVSPSCGHCCDPPPPTSRDRLHKHLLGADEGSVVCGGTLSSRLLLYENKIAHSLILLFPANVQFLLLLGKSICIRPFLFFFFFETLPTFSGIFTMPIVNGLTPNLWRFLYSCLCSPYSRQGESAARPSVGSKFRRAVRQSLTQ